MLTRRRIACGNSSVCCARHQNSLWHGWRAAFSSHSTRECTGLESQDLHPGRPEQTQSHVAFPLGVVRILSSPAFRRVWAGVDLIAVQHLLGHASITMTARYAHALADDKMAAVKLLDGPAGARQPVPNRSPRLETVGLGIAGKSSGMNAVGV